MRLKIFYYYLYCLQLVVAVNNLNQEKAEKTKFSDENKMLKASLEEKNKEIEELSKSLDDYKWVPI